MEPSSLRYDLFSAFCFMKSGRKGERKETQGDSRTCEKSQVSGFSRRHGEGVEVNSHTRVRLGLSHLMILTVVLMCHEFSCIRHAESLLPPTEIRIFFEIRDFTR